MTAGKERYEEFQKTALEIFIEERCTFWPGKTVLWKDFFNKFHKELSDDDPQGKTHWSQKRVSMELPEQFPTGRVGQETHFYVGNMVLDCKTLPTGDDLRQPSLNKTKGRRLS
jgi:hypothetical protein